MLLGQGTTDTLFTLQQGIANWQHALTARRAHGEHLRRLQRRPRAARRCCPRGVDVTSDPCSEQLAGGTFADLALRFMNEKLKGRDTGLRGYGRYHLATPDSTCTTVGSVAAERDVDVGTVATTEAASAPAIAYPVAEGPIRIAGSPYLTGDADRARRQQPRVLRPRASVRRPLDAHLVQNNVLPLNEPDPVLGEQRRITLPSVAVDVPAGQTLYVIATAISDTFGGHGQPDARRRPDRGHGGAPPRRGQVTDLA